MPRQIDIDQINKASTVQIRTRLNQDAVERYMNDFEKLPPITVWEVRGHEGFILADGFHRVEAASRLNLDKIKAEVFQGTLNEAMEFAVKANLTHGMPLTKDERESAVLRMKRLHPDWSRTKIAKVMGISVASVSMYVGMSEVRKEVTGKVPARQHDLRNVHTLPKKQWAPILEATQKRGWSSQDLKVAVKNLKDPDVPETLKQDLLEGKADPIVFKDGEPAFTIETIKRRVVAATKEDAALALLKMEETMVKIERFTPKQIISELDAEQAQRIVDEMPEHISYLDKLLSEAKTAKKPKEVSA